MMWLIIKEAIMKKQFKLFALSLSILILLHFFPTVVSAKADATVFAETFTASTEKVIVPINISSNTELMGFKITVAYPTEQIKIKSVSRGSVTAKGNFNTNFGVTDGSFDIIWNNTSPVDANGTLFALTVDTSNVKYNTEIRLTFSQPDTFDGSYNDVLLTMQSIKISALGTETESTTFNNKDSAIESTFTDKDTTENATTETSQTNYDNSQVADSVNNSLSAFDKDNIYEILPEEEDEFLESVNNNMQTILGSNNNFYEKFDHILNTYENYYIDSFKSDIILNLYSSEIQGVIDEVLVEVKADSINDVKDIENFNELVEEKFNEKLPDREPISDKIKDELVFDTIEYLYNISSQTNSLFQNQNVPQQDTNNEVLISKYIFIIPITIAIISVLAVALIVKVRKKKTKSNRKPFSN